MDRGFYASLSGMMCATKQLNDIANNVANVNTVGYKKDRSPIGEFVDLIVENTKNGVGVGNLSNQVYITDTFTDFSLGAHTQTNVTTDYALLSDGFFKVEKNGETFYTRDGNFNIDLEGYLCTDDGGYVLDVNGKRILADANTDYSSELMVVNFEDLNTLEKTDYNYFVNKYGLSEEYREANAIVKQGFLEGSNVDVASELTDLIKVQRYFQMNQKSLSVRDTLLEAIANNKI